MIIHYKRLFMMIFLHYIFCFPSWRKTRTLYIPQCNVHKCGSNFVHTRIRIRLISTVDSDPTDVNTVALNLSLHFELGCYVQSWWYYCRMSIWTPCIFLNIFRLNSTKSIASIALSGIRVGLFFIHHYCNIINKFYTEQAGLWMRIHRYLNWNYVNIPVLYSSFKVQYLNSKSSIPV
mgnify:CR=1 FL=1